MSELVKKAKAPKAKKAEERKFKKTRTPFRERFNASNVGSLLGKIFIYLLLIEIAFIIVYPLFTKLSAALMSEEDLFDRTVTFIPRHPTLENIIVVFRESSFLKALGNTFLIALLSAVLQTAICSFTGFGLAKLKSRWANLVMGMVILAILIPNQVILIPLYLKFRFFDIFGLYGLLTGEQGPSLMNTLWPIILLSITGYGFKNGLYIFIMRQFYKGVPEELEEAASIDGYGTFATFFRIILPMAIPMMITIFMFAFSWQWTDTFYSGIFFSNFKVLANTIFTMSSATSGITGGAFSASMYLHTGVLMAILPLIIIYVVAQRWIIGGIERSGLVG
ncbi:MAG: carbohydrate ABC transporter permease [Ruminococcaceae bacterium]|nr:carbohydrate ABC transporter permease [Oscillospiraceae bacterium]